MKKRDMGDLFALGRVRSFHGRALEQISFPLGGIGTGCIGLNGLGGLCDFEIFNRPNAGTKLDYTFPVIYAKEKGKDPVCRVLEAPKPPPHIGGGGGDPCANGEGFPHMDNATFRGEYPFAWVEFECRRLPVQVQLEAYNPFIPSNADDSGFPAAILKYTLTNRTQNTVEASVAWSMQNPIGATGRADGDPLLGPKEYGYGKNLNQQVETGGVRGVLFSSRKWKKTHPRFGQLALTTPEKSVTVMKYWSREPFFAPRHEFWDTFSSTGQLPDHDYGPSDEGKTTPGGLGVRMRLAPEASRTITFYVTWYFPNYEKYWEGADSFEACCGAKDKGKAKKANPTWKNYYATQFKDALDVAVQLHAREKALYADTQRFHDAFFSTTLPPYVLDAVSSQMSVLKSPTVLRLPDGTFYGFEGCAPGSGCCEGSCTHVWNYQQTLPFLFPELERSMRAADYKHNLRKDGSMGFRLNLPLGAPPNDFLPCADGQMGGIIKTYRDWKISGDDAWLADIWPQVKRALEYAWKEWDKDKSGVMTGLQHNTYDIEFAGPNPLTACLYLGALLAGTELARHFGEDERAQEYHGVFERGRAWVEAHLFNGEYYIQQYDPEDAPVHQFGKGCLSDQVLGQWMAQMAGLGRFLDPRHLRSALVSIFEHNWRADLREHANAQRVYAINDEAGLLLCSWPKGGRPKVPFIYSDEVWTGIEYHVASHCILEGLVKEGLTIVNAVRERHDGVARNPWDEFECGHHYARAMSAYGLLLALSGFSYDKGAGAIGFAPRVRPEQFQCFWALDGAWGVFRQHAQGAELEVAWGELVLNRLDAPWLAGAGKCVATLGKRRAAAAIDGFGSVVFAQALRIQAGGKLTVSL